VEIVIRNLQKKLPIKPLKIKKLVLKILKKEKIKKTGCINICLVNNPLIKKFNLKFLKKNTSTDVLAFDLSGKKEKKYIFTDIIISTDMAINQAAKFKTTANNELLLYVAHGLLHILGYNDHTQAQKKLMRKKEAAYVN